MTYPRKTSRQVGALAAAALVLTALSGAWTSEAQAAPTLRYQIDQRGDLILFGNTVGYDCRAGIPAPRVGTVNATMCGTDTDDSSVDVLWRSEDGGTATAGPNVTPLQARSTAILSLPTGSTVIYARMYWSASLQEGSDGTMPIALERPGSGGFMQQISVGNMPGQDYRVLTGGKAVVYQASADVTRTLQTYGPGAYRVSQIPSYTIVNENQDVTYVAWSMVVLYKNDQDPVRNLTVYDGLDSVAIAGQSVDVSLRGFKVPTTGNFDAKLGVIAYEGDHDKVGDSLIFNGTPLTNGTNPADNFFNSTRSYLGTAQTTVGDLPQMDGTPASMNGLDLDVVDVKAYLTAGANSATLRATTGLTNPDVYYIGGFAVSIGSTKPIIETTLTVPPNASTKPGDKVEYTLTSKNVGNDTGTNVYIDVPIPPGLSFVPGSIKIVSGPNAGTKTDPVMDDQGEYNPQTRTVRIRIGTGASGTTGGSITPSDPPIVCSYMVQIDGNAGGPIPTQATTTSTPGGDPTVPPTGAPSSDGVFPNRPTVITVQVPADLSIKVRTEPDPPQPQMPVTHIILVNNKGPATAPPGTQVTYTIPPGVMVQKVTPGPNWTCTMDQSKITCTYNSPIPIGDTPDIRITVVPPSSTGPDPTGETPFTTRITVGSPAVSDPDPSNNTIDYVTEYGLAVIAGGGFSCTLTRRPAAAPLLGIGLLGLAVVGLIWRRRRSARA